MGVRVRLTRNSSAYFPFWLAIPVMLVWYTFMLVVLIVYGTGWLLVNGVRLIANRGEQRRQAPLSRQKAQRETDWEARSFRDAPVRDVRHNQDGSVSFTLPGNPGRTVTLENGRFGRNDFTHLAEGDKVSGTFTVDGQGFDSLFTLTWHERRWTGWAEDVKRAQDGTTSFTVRFTKTAMRPQGRESLPVKLNAGEMVRWQDGRPFRLRDGSWLTVIFNPDGSVADLFHETPPRD